GVVFGSYGGMDHLLEREALVHVEAQRNADVRQAAGAGDLEDGLHPPGDVEQVAAVLELKAALHALNKFEFRVRQRLLVHLHVGAHTRPGDDFGKIQKHPKLPTRFLRGPTGGPRSRAAMVMLAISGAAGEGEHRTRSRSAELLRSGSSSSS